METFLLPSNVLVITNQSADLMCCCWRQEWRAAGVEQLRLSTVDLTGVPSLQNLHRGVEFALEHRERGTSVYVHCKAGRSRSATLAAAYLIRVSAGHTVMSVCSVTHRSVIVQSSCLLMLLLISLFC